MLGTYNTVRINQGQNQRLFNKKVLTTYVCPIYRMEGLLEYTFLHMYFCFQTENQVKIILSFEVPATLCCRYPMVRTSALPQWALVREDDSHQTRRVMIFIQRKCRRVGVCASSLNSSLHAPNITTVFNVMYTYSIQSGECHFIAESHSL